jgi:hypothetical protein
MSATLPHCGARGLASEPARSRRSGGGGLLSLCERVSFRIVRMPRRISSTAKTARIGPEGGASECQNQTQCVRVWWGCGMGMVDVIHAQAKCLPSTHAPEATMSYSFREGWKTKKYLPIRNAHGKRTAHCQHHDTACSVREWIEARRSKARRGPPAWPCRPVRNETSGTDMVRGR